MNTLTVKLPQDSYQIIIDSGSLSQIGKDPDLFTLLERAKTIDSFAKSDPELLQTILVRSAKAKADVVSKDEKEAGLRAILNYGHTIGHAVESLTNYQCFVHGEAVAIGMVTAGKIAAVMGNWRAKDFGGDGAHNAIRSPNVRSFRIRYLPIKDSTAWHQSHVLATHTCQAYSRHTCKIGHDVK